MLEDGFAALIELCPDTYFIWVSQNGERNILSVEAFLLRMFDRIGSSHVIVIQPDYFSSI